MISVFEKEQDCCGCTACASICPKNAISMVENAKGFKYPVIDQEKCVDCGLCVKTCNFKAFEPTGNKPDAYAARHVDTEEVRTSRSGAFFMALCKYAAEQGGAVFGCTLTDELDVKHCSVDSYDKCYIFKGSKYVQSDMGNCFNECADLLKNGKLVVFSGTGCQAHGLLSFLDKKNISTEKLVTIDLVCHGVPSPKIWKDFVAELEKNTCKNITGVDFRDKNTFGWRESIEKYTFSDGSSYHSKSWTQMFYRHVLFRSSCYNCKYTTTQRNTDFTIADYWGIDKNAPRFDDNKGVSLVLVHTNKGREIIKEIKDSLDMEQTNVETSMQPQLNKPIWKGYDYNAFWKAYRKNPQKAIKKYFFPSALRTGYLKLEKKAKQTIKKILKKIKK